MRVTLAVVAGKFELNSDRTVDISGISTGMIVSAVPYEAPRLDLVVAFSASPAEVGREKRIEIVLLEGDDKVKTYRTTIEVPEAPRPGIRPASYVHFPLKNVPFPRSGDYTFVVMVEEDEKAEVPFYVTLPEGGP